jgi:hypothetical protein
VKDPGDRVRFVIKDGNLQVGNVGDDDTYPVEAMNENQFRVAVTSDELTFSTGKPGAPQQLTIKHDDRTVETFSAVPAFDPSAAQLAEYAGVYSSREIDPLYEIKVEHVRTPGTAADQNPLGIVLFRLKNDPDPLRPVAPDFFNANLGKIRFTRDSKGAINGFLLSTGRIIDLRFERGRPGIPAR